MIKKLVIVVGGILLVIGAAFGFDHVKNNPEPVPSDVNEDGAVDLQDVSIVLSNIKTE